MKKPPSTTVESTVFFQRQLERRLPPDVLAEANAHFDELQRLQTSQSDSAAHASRCRSSKVRESIRGFIRDHERELAGRSDIGKATLAKMQRHGDRLYADYGLSRVPDYKTILNVLRELTLLK